MSLPTLSFRLPSRTSHKALAAALATRCAVKREAKREFERTYLDTFDGRLYRAGWTLTWRQETAGSFLESREPMGTLLCRVPAARVPRFAVDLPPGGLAESLGERIAPRRLLVQARVEVRSIRFRCLDDRQKTLAWVAVERRRVRFATDGEAPLPLPTRVVVEPLRGFEEASADLGAACGELGLPPTDPDELAEVLALIDRQPGHDPARFHLELDRQESAGAALVTVYQTLLGTVRATEDGVRRDLDPEFLHDFRVALRRSRSTLGQLRGVFAEEPTERFRRDLGRLARETGPARDLDVFAEEIAAEAAEAGLVAPLEPLLVWVHRQRRRAGRRLLQALDSPRTARTLADWTAFLAAPEWGPTATQPARTVFGEALARSVRRLLKRGGKIDPESPPEAFHRLRIDAKKLRYVLETGASLFDADEVAARLGPVKRLQELLGEGQDLAVREARLADAANELTTGAGPATLVALGRLIERAHRRRLQGYREFPERFEEFASGAEQKRWSRLLRASR